MKKALVMILIACLAFSVSCSVANQGIPVSTDQTFTVSSEVDDRIISNVDDFKSAVNELSVNDTNLIKLRCKNGCMLSMGEETDTDKIGRIVALMNSIEIEELSQDEIDEIYNRIDAQIDRHGTPIGGADDYWYFDFYGNRNIDLGGFVVYWDADDFTDRTCIYAVSGKKYSISNMDKVKDELYSLIRCYN